MPDNEVFIHLSENRKCNQTDTFRSLITFPNLASKSPFDSILKFADNTLSAQNSQRIIVDNCVVIVLIPLVGAIEIIVNHTSKIIESGEIVYIFLQKSDAIIIQNPYEEELINYLEIWIKNEDVVQNSVLVEKFDVINNPNKLVKISSYTLANFFIGKYNGRKDDFLTIEKNAFVFVINGVFEVQNRLLEARSGLALCNVEQLDFEGLGRENIILVICT